MNPARTLAERFRTQRTDRIRVDGAEVLSLVELAIDGPVLVEIVIESHRSDIEQLLIARTRRAELRCGLTDDPVEQLVIPSGLQDPAEFVIRPELGCVLRFWNCWVVDGTTHAWTGNAGIVVEDLDPPPSAARRFRLWCSDGLGNPDFTDIVAVVTLGPLEDLAVD